MTEEWKVIPQAKNLRWATPLENRRDDYRHGKIMFGEKNHMTKLSEDDVRDIRWLVSEGARRKDVAASYGVCRQLVDGIITGRFRASVI